MLIQNNRAHSILLCVEVYRVPHTKRAYCNIYSGTYSNNVYRSHVPLYSSQLATAVDIFNEIKTILTLFLRPKHVALM